MQNYLNDIWTIYFHNPNDVNWENESYTLITTISDVNSFVDFFITFKDLLYKGMFFIMRDDIMPRWEDEKNKSGGCFSYKLSKFNLEDKLFELCSQILGETMGTTDEISNFINGISISPKKNYYIVRIWIRYNNFANKNLYNLTIPKYSALIYKNH